MKKILQISAILMLALGSAQATQRTGLINVIGGSADALVTRQTLERLIAGIKETAERSGTVTDGGSEGRSYKISPVNLRIPPLTDPSSESLVEGVVEPTLRVKTLRATPRPVFWRELNISLGFRRELNLPLGINANIMVHKNIKAQFGQLEVWVTRDLANKLPPEALANPSRFYLNLVRRTIVQLLKVVKAAKK
ncbi:MAG: hypothetical protein HY401_05145 [Elusimicrobia bacterium]|nr:hypothetical protein [Elusimicrobiota bacterium]